MPTALPADTRISLRMIACRSDSGLPIRSSNPVAKGVEPAAGASVGSAVSAAKAGAAASPGTSLQSAHPVVEHLVQVLVDLPVGLGDLFAKFLAAAAEILGVEILLDVLLHLPANRLPGHDFGRHRLGGRRRRRRRGSRPSALGVAATGGATA